MPAAPERGSASTDHWLDRFAKGLAAPASTPRRTLLARVGAGLVAAVTSSLLLRSPRADAYGLSQCTPGSGTAQCPPGTTCIAGLCLQPFQTSYCPPGSSYCGGQCINTQADPTHCGGCNIQCPFGVPCTYGACTIVEAPVSICRGGGSQSAVGGGVTVAENGVTITAVGTGGGGQLALAGCGSNPMQAAAPAGTTTFFDLQLAPGYSFTSVTLTLCSTTNSSVYWYSPAGGWQAVNPPPAIESSSCSAVTITGISSPALSDLTGTGFGVLPCAGQGQSCNTIHMPCCDPNISCSVGGGSGLICGPPCNETLICVTGCCDPASGTCKTGITTEFCGPLLGICQACGPGEICGPAGCCVPGVNCGQCGPTGTFCTSGCCDQASGTCQAGNTTEFCGPLLGICQACGPGEICGPTGCVTNCAVAGCSNGCCDPTSGLCSTGNLPQQCGPVGGTCTSCAIGVACVNHTCVPVSCAATCAGCCDANGQCHYPSNTKQYCGYSGGPCATCATGQHCLNAPGAYCVCDSTSCSGCCDSTNNCQTTSNTTCGVGGGQCVNCGAGTCGEPGSPGVCYCPNTTLAAPLFVCGGVCCNEHYCTCEGTGGIGLGSGGVCHCSCPSGSSPCGGTCCAAGQTCVGGTTCM